MILLAICLTFLNLLAPDKCKKCKSNIETWEYGKAKTYCDC